MTYALTFEHDTKPTFTIRGSLTGTDPEMALRKALRIAEGGKQGKPPRGWTSLCLVVEMSQLAGVPDTVSRENAPSQQIDRQPAAS